GSAGGRRTAARGSPPSARRTDGRSEPAPPASASDLDGRARSRSRTATRWIPVQQPPATGAGTRPPRRWAPDDPADELETPECRWLPTDRRPATTSATRGRRYGRAFR